MVESGESLRCQNLLRQSGVGHSPGNHHCHCGWRVEVESCLQGQLSRQGHVVVMPIHPALERKIRMGGDSALTQSHSEIPGGRMAISVKGRGNPNICL